jgi:serine phosphatase RsbU (regulator of sigma subunit)
LSATDAEPSSASVLTAAPNDHSRRVPGALTAVLVLVAGLAITAVVAWSAEVQYREAESRLLLEQTRQAGDVLLSAIPATQLPLATASELALATGGSPTVFRAYMRARMGGATGFLSASLWSIHDGRVTVVTSLGHDATDQVVDARDTVASRALDSGSFVVIARLSGMPRRLTYADGIGTLTKGFVVYAERALPRNMRSRVASSNTAFSELRYAIYLGQSANPRTLLSTDLPGGLPTGDTARVTVPFGNSQLTLVAVAAQPLTGDVPAHLPWILGGFGLVLSIAGALLALRLVNGRRAAEGDAAEIALLNHTLADLYAEQRTIAVTLQRSLLPVRTPDLEGLEVAVRYLPGAEGAEIGGDWYSAVSIDGGRFGVVVGDVSGRGVRAAAVMAALRFTIRTLVLEGNAPADVLGKCVAHVKDLTHGHLATVLLGIGDLGQRTITMTSAGHLMPLLVADGLASYLEVPVGVPIGAPGRGYGTATISVPQGATLLLFTDGLVERRGENLDVGLERLAAAAARAPRDLDAFITSVCEELTEEADDDDVAMLALRWSS